MQFKYPKLQLQSMESPKTVVTEVQAEMNQICLSPPHDAKLPIAAHVGCAFSLLPFFLFSFFSNPHMGKVLLNLK